MFQGRCYWGFHQSYMLRILVLFYDVRKKLPIYFMFCFVELVKVVSMTPAATQTCLSVTAKETSTQLNYSKMKKSVLQMWCVILSVMMKCSITVKAPVSVSVLKLSDGYEAQVSVSVQNSPREKPNTCLISGRRTKRTQLKAPNISTHHLKVMLVQKQIIMMSELRHLLSCPIPHGKLWRGSNTAW